MPPYGGLSYSLLSENPCCARRPPPHGSSSSENRFFDRHADQTLPATQMRGDVAASTAAGGAPFGRLPHGTKWQLAVQTMNGGIQHERGGEDARQQPVAIFSSQHGEKAGFRLAMVGCAWVEPPCSWPSSPQRGGEAGSSSGRVEPPGAPEGGRRAQNLARGPHQDGFCFACRDEGGRSRRHLSQRTCEHHERDQVIVKVEVGETQE